jgi:two-component system response regulator YesN
MNIIVADDERLARITLISMLTEIGVDKNIIREAKNGEELYEMIKKKKPSIAFVDIQMPKMNGLESIKKAKEISPRTNWIILTGFSRFDYAKEAIKLGVSHYLLKPVMPEELKSVYNEILDEYNEKIRIANADFNNEVVAMLYHRNYDFTRSEMQQEPRIFLGGILCVDNSQRNIAKIEYQSKVLGLIDEVMGEIVTKNTNIGYVNVSNESIAIVFRFLRKNDVKTKNIVDKFFKRLMYKMRESDSCNSAYTLVYTDYTSSFKQMKHMMKSIIENMNLRAISGINKEYVMKFKRGDLEADSCNKISDEVVALSTAYRQYQYLKYNSALEKLSMLINNNGVQADSEVADNIRLYLSTTMECDFSGQGKMYLKKIAAKGEDILKISKKNNVPEDIIEQIKGFVSQNYMLDINEKNIASNLGITPNYLSSLFHEKTGTTFIKYLTKIRIMKAKELLIANPNMNVQTIAKQIGYYSTSYFTKTFKKYYNISPSQYRNSINDNKE